MKHGFIAESQCERDCDDNNINKAVVSTAINGIQSYFILVVVVEKKFIILRIENTPSNLL
jgi:hypothetical protein